MALVHYTAEVKSGRLLELPIEAEQLHLRLGDKIHIQLDENLGDTPVVRPNVGMIAALQEIEERQKLRQHTDGSSTNKMLREARTGAMWGHDPID